MKTKTIFYSDNKMKERKVIVIVIMDFYGCNYMTIKAKRKSVFIKLNTCTTDSKVNNLETRVLRYV